jgi:hypothetical protein
MMEITKAKVRTRETGPGELSGRLVCRGRVEWVPLEVP